MRRRLSVSLLTLLFFFGVFAVGEVWAAATDDNHLVSDDRSGRRLGHDYWYELRFHPRNEHRQVQWNNRDGDELEYYEHRRHSANWSDNRERSGHGFERSKQWKSFTVVSAPSITSLSITTGAVGATVTLTGSQFRRDARNWDGEVQWHDSNSDKLERDARLSSRCQVVQRQETLLCSPAE